MQRPRLLIANSSPEFCRTMTDAFRGFADTECCHSGRQALDLLRARQHPLMLLDLSLPELDGLTVLKAAQSEGILPAVLVTMDMQSVYIAQALSRLHVSYAMVKPCDPEAVLANMQDIAASMQVAQPCSTPTDTDAVAETLRKLHLNPKHDGYQYLKTAIPLFSENPGQFVTKELYTAVGKPFGKTGQLVERSMRKAIESAWEADTDGMWQKYFPGMTARPANKVFIAAMARLLFPSATRHVG